MKEELTKKVNEIKDTISNKEEAEKVMNSVSELITMFTDKLLEISERQVKLEEKTEEIFDVLSQIEEEMIENLNDFEAACPYCGEMIPFRIPEDGEEFECPKCGNVIEMELLFDEADGCCDGSCGEHHCHGCHHDEDEEDEK